MNGPGGDGGQARAAVFWGRRLFSGLSLGTGVLLVFMATPGISTGDRLFAVLGVWMMSSIVGVVALGIWMAKLRLNDATGTAASLLLFGPKRLVGITLGLGLATYAVGLVIIVITGQSIEWTIVNLVGVSVFFVAGTAGPIATLLQTYQLNARLSATR